MALTSRGVNIHHAKRLTLVRMFRGVVSAGRLMLIRLTHPVNHVKNSINC